MDQNEDNKSKAQAIFNQFIWFYKKNFNWVWFAHNKVCKRNTFMGEIDMDNSERISTIMKQIKLDQPKKYFSALKEVFFLSCFKKNKFFTEIIDVFLSDDSKNLFIILREEGTDLEGLIKFNNFNYNERYQTISRSIIFQVACGLKILHDNNLSHNDIKPKNIIISGEGKVKICDLGSTDNTAFLAIKDGTNGYYSPQNILGKDRKKEDDMQGLGVVLLELLEKRCGIFYLDIKENKEKNLKNILNKYFLIKNTNGNWNEDIEDNNIINLIKDDNYTFEAKINFDNFPQVKFQEDKTLIENLLKINPKERWTADQVMNYQTFRNLNKSLDLSNVNFKQEDYNNYFLNLILFDEELFKKYLKEIKEKFIGKTIFDKK